MKLTPSSKIFLADSKIQNAGRGVFANKKIKKDESIEVCPVIIIPQTQLADLRKTEFLNYYFMWDDDPKHHRAAVCLGFGSIYNHSYTPNATYRKNKDDNTIEFTALKDIDLHEEITVNYNHGDPNDSSKLWIESIPASE